MMTNKEKNANVENALEKKLQKVYLKVTTIR